MILTERIIQIDQCCQKHPDEPSTLWLASVYSALNASAGSTRDARRAGIQLANIAIATSNSDAPASVTGSLGATPYRNDRRKRATTVKSNRPTPIPAAVSTIPCFVIIAATALGCAPSAMRTPSSFVRSVTTYAITPYKPIPPSINVTRAAAPSTMMMNDSCAIDALNTVVMGFTSNSGIAGSSSRTARCTAVVIAAGSPTVLRASAMVRPVCEKIVSFSATWGKYTAAAGGAASAVSRVSPTTPITV